MSLLYLIVFPPKTGGNHLSNLILTSEIFSKFVNDSNYKEHLLNYYTSPQNKFNVHYHSLMIKENLFDKIHTNGPILMCCHVETLMIDYDWFTDIGRPIQIILLDIPSVTNGTRSYNLDTICLYKSNVIKALSTLSLAPFAPIISLSSDLFLIKNTQIFKHLNDELDLNLNLDYCQKLHSIWIDKILNA
jgi:hypothetical protein